jgi:hypothetical protein
MANLIVRDLEEGVALDRAAAGELRGGANTLNDADQNTQGAWITQGGGVSIGSPNIITQVNMDNDLNAILNPITSITSNLHQLFATNSALQNVSLSAPVELPFAL